ncbi:type I polyketide synthase [Streptomyces adonidis]|uniref:type I polyketide synthase n=1 Tax=Streptomyces adonidis TaxID=3231367 RepID=UPI0034DAEFF5
MHDQVAVVGMALRTSGADDIHQFWDLLRNGRSGRTELSHADLSRRGVPSPRYTHHEYVPVTYPLENSLAFDTEAFRFSVAEAEITDPQHRLMLEGCYRAVENSGHYIGSLPGIVGVYLGARPSNHGALIGRELWEQADTLDLTRLGIGNDPDYLSNRVSYKYGLTGPALTVQTACSTSAVAIHLAVQAILAGECDSAITGGVSMDLQDAGYLYREGGIYSRRGLCEPFMATADGTVEGNGVAALFLRRLDLAVADGDRVLAVIAGTAVNNDGRARAGFAAPGVVGQRTVIEEALEVAQLKADQIGMFEAHGTGTSVGDALEVEAASHAYLGKGGVSRSCRLHSIKANVGHLAAAAGAAGVIAAILALRHEEIPPNLPLVHGVTPVELGATPFFLSDEVRPWRRGKAPRYAAVSSFGLGGTNAHLILGDADDIQFPRQGQRRGWQLLPLSADDPTRLTDTVRATRTLVEEACAEDRHGIGHTLRTGRPALGVRTCALVPADPAEPGAQWSPSDTFTEPGDHSPDIVYLLPGQGGTASDAAHRLYLAEAEFRATVDRGLTAMRRFVTQDTYARIVAAFEHGSHTGDTQVAQPVLHLVSLGIHAVLEHLGVRPAAILGHSVGEVTGACLSGVLSFEDAARAVCDRATAMADMAPGAMFAVRASVEDLHGLPEGCAVSVVNGPRASVVSAAADAVRPLLEWLDRRHAEHRRLDTSHAFHHQSMTAAATRFAQQLTQTDLAAPRIPLMSCRSGDWLTGPEAADPVYWGGQLRDRVEFARAVRTAATRFPDAMYVQLGPGTSLVRAMQLGGVSPDQCLAALPGEGADAHKSLLWTVGRLWERGAEVDWAAYAEADSGLRAPAPPRLLKTTPILHPSLSGLTPAIDPADLDRRTASPAATARTEGAEDELQPLVEAVTGCWAEVLGAAPAPQDDFFSQGGDSIAAAQLVARLRSIFPVDIPVHLPLTARSPQGIARALDDLFIASIVNS